MADVSVSYVMLVLGGLGGAGKKKYLCIPSKVQVKALYASRDFGRSRTVKAAILRLFLVSDPRTVV